MELADIKPGMAFSDLHALVSQKTLGTTKTGQTYVDITLRSGDTTLKCKKWSYKAEKYDGILSVGKVIKVVGTADLYNGELQGTITEIEPSNRSVEEFIHKSRFDTAILYTKMLEVAHSFEDPMLKYVTTYLLSQHKEEFYRSPAALGMHHAWYGGLVEHTYNMLALAMRITKLYQEQYGAKYFSRDLVLCGVILHDIGKIFEYDSSIPGAFKMKPEGVLANHLVRGPILVHDAATDWYTTLKSTSLSPTQEQFEHNRDLLVHLIASHHGSHEFGSAALPSCLEAVLLHQIDMIDSQFMQALQLIEGKAGEVAGFSERAKVGNRVQFLQRSV